MTDQNALPERLAKTLQNIDALWESSNLKKSSLIKNKVKEALVILGWSQQKLAKEISVSPALLSNFFAKHEKAIGSQKFKEIILTLSENGAEILVDGNGSSQLKLDTNKENIRFGIAYTKHLNELITQINQTLYITDTTKSLIAKELGLSAANISQTLDTTNPNKNRVCIQRILEALKKTGAHIKINEQGAPAIELDTENEDIRFGLAWTKHFDSLVSQIYQATDLTDQSLASVANAIGISPAQLNCIFRNSGTKITRAHIQKAIVFLSEKGASIQIDKEGKPHLDVNIPEEDRCFNLAWANHFEALSMEIKTAAELTGITFRSIAKELSLDPTQVSKIFKKGGGLKSKEHVKKALAFLSEKGVTIQIDEQGLPTTELDTNNEEIRFGLAWTKHFDELVSQLHQASQITGVSLRSLEKELGVPLSSLSITLKNGGGPKSREHIQKMISILSEKGASIQIDEQGVPTLITPELDETSIGADAPPPARLNRRRGEDQQPEITEEFPLPSGSKTL